MLKLDPGKCLHEYMDCMALKRQHIQGHPVFITFPISYSALSARSVSRMSNEAIGLTGLSVKNFTAKCFIPTRRNMCPR